MWGLSHFDNRHVCARISRTVHPWICVPWVLTVAQPTITHTYEMVLLVAGSSWHVTLWPMPFVSHSIWFEGISVRHKCERGHWPLDWEARKMGIMDSATKACWTLWYHFDHLRQKLSMADKRWWRPKMDCNLRRNGVPETTLGLYRGYKILPDVFSA